MDFVSQLLTLVTHSPAETQALAAHLAQQLQAGDVLWLSGDLGAGKTTFAQGLGRGLQVSAALISPTFVLVREYEGRLPLYHIDLYRLDAVRDVLNLGLRDYLDGDGVCVIEWAERFDPNEAEPGLHIRIEPQGDNTRAFTFAACGDRAAELLVALRNQGGRPWDGR
jgi:tRNA threonylcarbamoyladenosine biosynthesis protein TsaE